MRTDLRLSRRSFVSALLAFLSPLRPQLFRPLAALMTPIAGWVRSLLCTGFVAVPGLPAAA